jgi:hypothetical protein
MRLASAVLLALGLSVATGQKPAHPGVERWPVKTSLPSSPGSAKTVALADLLSFVDPVVSPKISKNDSRFQSARIPPFSNSLGIHEGELITTTGWLHLVAGESDGDYHIQISASATDGNNCIIVEVPNPDPAFVADAALRPQFEQVRTFLKSKTLANKEPSSGGSVMAHPPFVKVTGQLFYDDSHVGDAPRGKKGMKAATLWELHPVTVMAFAAKPAK